MGVVILDSLISVDLVRICSIYLSGLIFLFIGSEVFSM